MPKKNKIQYLIPFSYYCNCPEKKSEPKEKLELQYISQKDFRGNNIQVIEQSFLYEETREPEQKCVFISQ